MSTLFRNKLARTAIVAILSAFILFGFFNAVLPAQPVHAAAHNADKNLAPAYTNAAQIQFYAIGKNGQPDRLWDAYVYGTNQNNQYAAWRGSGNGNTTFVTDNWWFQGNIHIDVWDGTDNSWHHENANVPSFGNGYTYVIYR